MLTIQKVRADCTIDFAAEELKKYLRMMMPKAGEIKISYDPQATEGFRLGLFEDFGIPFEGKDIDLDDVVHIETTEEGGILAGSNPRSVLFAVYRYLKINGCRFLFPGAEGEYIPRTQVKPVSYHHAASYRYRGHTTEGAPSLEQVLIYIDYHAKQELNAYGLYEIYPYHNIYYSHRYNEELRPAEPLDRDVVDQWDVLFQAELTKRGMQICGGGHGWTDRVAGFDLKDRAAYQRGEKQLTEEIRGRLAMINGVRGLYRNDPSFTQICMSQKELRDKYIELMADYLTENPLLRHSSVLLGDLPMNHCECEECQKTTPSDFYVMLLNGIDEKLTQRGVKTKLHISAYTDCMFPPVKEKLHNPDRFILKATPISRSYSSGIDKNTVYPPMQEYVRNKWTRPKNATEYYAQFRGWQALFPECESLIYEYHYWWPQYKDPGSVRMSHRVFTDALSWKLLNANGCMQDGSNKSFWPNGFVDHIYGAVLWDDSIDYDEELEDYYRHIYGEDWKTVYECLEGISDAFDHSYMSGEKSLDKAKGRFYNPDHAKNVVKAKDYAQKLLEAASQHMAMTVRPQSLCWRLLLRYGEYIDRLADVVAQVCLGELDKAKELFEQFRLDMGRYTYETERFFDFAPAIKSLSYLVAPPPKKK